MVYGYSLSTEKELLEKQFDGDIRTDLYGTREFPEFQELVQDLEPSDQLVVPTLASMGCTLSEICDKWQQVEGRKADIQVLDCPLEMEHEDLFSDFLTYLLLEERKMHIRRQHTAMEMTRASDRHVGRKPKEIPDQFDDLYHQYRLGFVPCREAARQLHVSHTTFLRWCRQAENEELLVQN